MKLVIITLIIIFFEFIHSKTQAGGIFYFIFYSQFMHHKNALGEGFLLFINFNKLYNHRIRSTMITRLTPYQKVACLIHLGFMFYSLFAHFSSYLWLKLVIIEFICIFSEFIYSKTQASGDFFLFLVTHHKNALGEGFLLFMDFDKLYNHGICCSMVACLTPDRKVRRQKGACSSSCSNSKAKQLPGDSKRLCPFFFI